MIEFIGQYFRMLAYLIRDLKEERRRQEGQKIAYSGERLQPEHFEDLELLAGYSDGVRLLDEGYNPVSNTIDPRVELDRKKTPYIFIPEGIELPYRTVYLITVRLGDEIIDQFKFEGGGVYLFAKDSVGLCLLLHWRMGTERLQHLCKNPKADISLSLETPEGEIGHTARIDFKDLLWPGFIRWCPNDPEGD